MEILTLIYSNSESMISGVLSSLVASVVWLWFFLGLKPKIMISDRIAQSVSAYGEKEYLFKVVNKGRYSIINIKAELYIVNKANVIDGCIDEYKKISLKTPEMMELIGLHKETHNDYFAFHFSTREDIEKLWDDDVQKRLRLKVIATHSISNFTKVFSKDFLKKGLIKKGEFVYGDSTELVEI